MYGRGRGPQRPTALVCKFHAISLRPPATSLPPPRKRRPPGLLPLPAHRPQLPRARHLPPPAVPLAAGAVAPEPVLQQAVQLAAAGGVARVVGQVRALVRVLF